MSSSSRLRLIDIGANLTDPKFAGVYNGSSKHPADLQHVLARAWEVGMERIMVTSGCIGDVYDALDIVKEDSRLVTTVGVHPTRAGEFEFGTQLEGKGEQDADTAAQWQRYVDLGLDGQPDTYLAHLQKLVEDNREQVVAVGECGLDYDRLHFCDKDTQQKYFELQFDLAENTQLPMFLHMRAACDDFLTILNRNRHRFTGGVVHSFDGSLSEANALLDAFDADQLYIGLNGCSLRTQESLDVVAKLPLERLMIETDAPWCGIKNTHPSKAHVTTEFPTVNKEKKWKEDHCVKNRSEPCHIVQVLEVVAALKDMDVAEVADTLFDNTQRLFFPSSSQ